MSRTPPGPGRSRLWLWLSLALAAALASPGAAAGQDRHVLIVVGLGGEERYRERFHEWASSLRDALIERHGVAEERVTYLGERPEMDPERIDGTSRSESVQAAALEIARRAGADDPVLIVLFGHGSPRGDDAVLNVPGPSMSGADFAEILSAFPTQPVALVNTASASAPFIPALSGPRRTIITATRTAQQRNETWFGGYFAQAFAGEDADLDKDGRVSLLEAYEYARREVARHYQERNLMQTENPLLDDDGDGRGSGEPDPEAGDGRLARAFTFGLALAAGMDASDPVLRALLQERAELERRLEALRARRADMDPEAYDRELEIVLVEIALKDQEIRRRGGGGGGGGGEGGASGSGGGTDAAGAGGG